MSANRMLHIKMTNYKRFIFLLLIPFLNSLFIECSAQQDTFDLIADKEHLLVNGNGVFDLIRNERGGDHQNFYTTTSVDNNTLTSLLAGPDCNIGSIQYDVSSYLCIDEPLMVFGSSGSGIDDFMFPGNGQGCLSSGERSSSWFWWEIPPNVAPGQTLEFTITPFDITDDYDFALFGPNRTCENLGEPIRCSWSALGGATGLLSGAGDETEGAPGDKFVNPITVNPGEVYAILIDNFSLSSNGFYFDISVPGAQCCPLVENDSLITLVCVGDSTLLNSLILNESPDTHVPVFIEWTGDTQYLDNPYVENPQLFVPSDTISEINLTMTIEVFDLVGFNDCSLQDSITIAVNTSSSNLLISDSLFCLEDEIQNLTVNIPGGEWSGSIDTNGTFNPLTLGTGNHFVSYQVLDGECYNLVEDSIAILPLLEVNITPQATGFCQTEGFVLLTAEVFGSNPPHTFEWSTPIGPMDSNSIEATIAGTYRVSVTNENGCLQVDSVEVQSYPSPTFSDPVTIYYCAAGEVINLTTDYTPEVLNAIAIDSAFWSIQGPTGEFNRIMNPNNFVVIEATVLRYVYTTVDGCEGQLSFNVMMADVPEGNNHTIHSCVTNALNFDLTTQNNFINDTHLVTWFDGDPSNGGALLVLPDAVDLTNYVSPNQLWAQVTNESCNTTLQVDVVLSPIPTLDAGLDFSQCAGSNVVLSAQANPSVQSVSWTGGDGIFIPNNTAFNPLYQFGTTDLINGFVNFLVEGNSGTANCNEVSDEVRVTIGDEITTFVEETLCEGTFISINGNVYDQDNPTGIEQFISYNGCDSIVHISLSFNAFSGTLNENVNGEECDQGNGTAAFDLSLLSNEVWNGTGIVNWFLDENLQQSITVTELFISQNTIVYATVIDEQGCVSEAVPVALTVLPLTQPVFSLLNTAYCISEIPIPLPLFDDNGRSGVWSSNEIDQEGIYIFTPVDNCFAEYTLTININSVDQPVLENLSSICENSISIQLPQIQDGMQGVWSGPGVNNNSFSPFGLSGLIDLIFNPVEECTISNTTEIEVLPVFETNISASICEGEVYVLNNTSYNSTGLFSETTSSTMGCDSIIYLNLLVQSPPTVNLDNLGEVCNSSNPIALSANQAGVEGTWSGSGVSENVFDPSGLEGEISLLFTPNNGLCFLPTLTTIQVGNEFITNLTESICEGESFIVNGIAYSNSGNFSETIPSSIGCDSIVNLSLTVNTPEAVQLETLGSLCNSETALQLPFSQAGVVGIWSGPGVEENAFNPQGLVGDIELVFTPDFGLCALPSATNIEVLDLVESNLIQTICEGESYAINGVSYSSAGQFSQTTTGTNGCDSIINLNLMVNTLEEVALDGFGVVCSSTNSFELPQIQGEVEGTWSGIGVFQNTFDPDGLSGTIELLFTPDNNNCYLATSTTIQIGEEIINNITVSICEGEVYNFNGMELLNMGLYSDTINLPECDSIVLLNLLVEPLNGVMLEHLGSICESAEPVELQNVQDGFIGNWSGNGVTNNVFDPLELAGTQILTFSPMNGSCLLPNSTIIEVIPNTFTSISDTICEGELYVLNGLSYTESGQYSQSLMGYAGCDSSLNLALSVVPLQALPTDMLPAFICEESPDLDLTISSTGIAGEWTGPGVAANFFSPANLQGNIEVLFTPDSDQCILETILTIEVINIELEFNTVAANTGMNNGRVEALVDGGVAPYSYEWSDPSFPSNSEVDNVAPGTYTLTVTDANNCFATRSVIVDELTSSSEATFAVKNFMNILPNPFREQIIVSLDSNKIKSLSILNSIGQIVGEYKVQNRKVMVIELFEISSGIYFMMGKDSEGKPVQVEKIVKL